jgi:hypothetical protein
MESTADLKEAAREVRSRRVLLAGAVGGLGAWLVSAAQRAMPAEAAVGDPMRLGRVNNAAGSNTTLQTSSLGPAYKVRQNGGGTAIRGESPAGHAAILETGSSHKFALLARNASGAPAAEGAAIFAEGNRHPGLIARSDTDYGIAAGSRTAPAIHASSQEARAIEAHSSGQSGVYGSSDAASGVSGFSSNGVGVSGFSNYGVGVSGHTDFGTWAGHFSGNVLIDKFCQFRAIPSPAAADESHARLFARVNGAGKTQLCVRFATGAVQVIATEP